ncbi:MAG: hypothetical protein GYB65_00075 [Chloroflexi bacterium]|nr:hypothetical protein [Chloroflexota bacterium]
MQTIDLKEAERRAFRSTHQDGLWDIYLGAIFVVFGAIPVLRNVAKLSEQASMIVHIMVLLIVMLLWIGGKKYITTPRVGMVKFSKDRQRKLMRARIVLFGSVALGMIVFALIASDTVRSLDFFVYVLAANILIVFGAMAYFMSFERLYYYAVLYALSMPVGLLLEDQALLSDAPYIFILTGGLPVVIGIALFARFLRDYPLHTEVDWGPSDDIN